MQYICNEKYQTCALQILTELLKLLFYINCIPRIRQKNARSPYASLSINITYTDSVYIMNT